MQVLINNWHNFDFRLASVVVIVYMVLDGMYAYYTVSVTKRKPVASASVGAAMHLLIAFGVLNYIQNYLYVIPIIIGSWIGTYLAVKHDLKAGM